jgi:hypothetical protein
MQAGETDKIKREAYTEISLNQYKNQNKAKEVL